MNLDFNKICRLCLKSTKGVVDLFPKNGVRDLSKEETDKIIEKIECCYDLQIVPNDELPTKVCFKCIQIVTLFYISKQNASNSDQFLKNSLLLKRLSSEDDVEEDQKSIEEITIVEDSSNEDHTPEGDTQIKKEEESSLEKNQELDVKNSSNLLPNPAATGFQKSNLVKNEESQGSATDLEKNSSKSNISVNNTVKAQFSKISSKALAVENLNKKNKLVLASKSKSLKLKKRAKKFLRKKSKFTVSSTNDNDVFSTETELLEEKKYNFEGKNVEDQENKTSNESYPKIENVESQSASKCTNKIDPVSHESNAVDNASSNSETSSTSVETKLKSELPNGEKKIVGKSCKNKEDKLKDYYENLLNADKSLKVKYCRLTSQKSKLRNEMVLEKKKTHDVNMKIYNLVRVTVNIANAVSEMTNFSEKEKMERVFDRLIKGDGESENFVKGHQNSEMNGGGENSSGGKLDECKKEPSSEKGESSNASGSFHKKLTANWNDLQANISEKNKSLDTSSVKSEPETPKDKTNVQKNFKKRPAEQVKVIGTIIDLDNVLPPDVKRKCVSKETGYDSSPGKSDTSTTPPKPILKKKKKIKSQTPNEKTDSNLKILKLKKKKLKKIE